MPLLDVDELIIKLAADFKLRGMDTHVDGLRLLYRERQRERRRSLARPAEGRRVLLWDVERVLHWCALLGIPPFQRIYPKVRSGSPCPGCGTHEEHGAAAFFTKTVWNGGSLAQCRVCAAEWLRDDAQAAQ